MITRRKWFIDNQEFTEEYRLAYTVHMYAHVGSVSRYSLPEAVELLLKRINGAEVKPTLLSFRLGAGWDNYQDFAMDVEYTFGNAIETAHVRVHYSNRTLDPDYLRISENFK